MDSLCKRQPQCRAYVLQLPIACMSRLVLPTFYYQPYLSACRPDIYSTPHSLAAEYQLQGGCVIGRERRVGGGGSRLKNYASVVHILNRNNN